MFDGFVVIPLGRTHLVQCDWTDSQTSAASWN